MVDDWKNAGFGIYIHWPFCLSKCPYCDFNSHVSASIDVADWQSAYLQELDRAARLLPGRVVNSIFFGGGTPSLMPVSLVEGILNKVSDLWMLANDLEVTLEANPTSVESDRFIGYRDAGVNRISVGVQALDDGQLKSLGRLHTVSEALTALDLASRVFDRVSFDLIYARQNQSLDDWQTELATALSMAPDHLSLYQLTIENNTAFGALHRMGRLKGLPNDDLAADMYDLTQSMCEDAGLPAYEVSNHAKAGAESRHNLIYWRYGDYLGIGPGAHGRLTVGDSRSATVCHAWPKTWLSSVAGGSGESEHSTLNSKDQALEYLMMSIRLTEGTDLRRLRSLHDGAVKLSNIIELKERGFLQSDTDRLIATAKGRIVLNSVLRELIAD